MAAGLALFTVVFLAVLHIEGVQMQQQMPKLVRCGEDPALDGHVIPRVHYDRRPAVLLAARQAKEAFRRDYSGKDLHAVVFQ